MWWTLAVAGPNLRAFGASVPRMSSVPSCPAPTASASSLRFALKTSCAEDERVRHHSERVPGTSDIYGRNNGTVGAD